MNTTNVTQPPGRWQYLPRIHPRIHLSKCQDCAGTGRRNAMRNGVVTQYECGTCFGHGDRLVHA